MTAFVLITVTVLGCRGSDHSSPPKPPENIAFDIDADTAVSASVESPTVVSTQDGKFHYKIRVKPQPQNTNSNLSVTPSPQGPKQWEDVYKHPEIKVTLKIDLAKSQDQSATWIKLRSVCDVSGEVSCWAPSGRLDTSLTAEVKKLLAQPMFSSRSGRKMNRLLVFQNEDQKHTWTRDVQNIGLDFESQEIRSTENLMLCWVNVDPLVLEMPFSIKCSRKNGEKSNWFEPKIGTSSDVGDYTITRVQRIPDLPPPTRNSLYVEINPPLNLGSFVEVKAQTDGPIEMRSVENYGRYASIGVQGLEDIKYLRIVYEEQLFVLWSNIPLRPKPIGSRS